MNAKLDAIIETVRQAKNKVVDTLSQCAPDDPKRDSLEEAEMGLTWVQGRLEQAKVEKAK